MIKFMKSNSKLIIVTIISLVTYVLANGEWSIPVFAWIYPMLFLWMVHSCPSSKMYFIIFGIYAIGFIIRFANVVGMNFGVCTVVAVFIATLNSLPYLFWQKSKRNFKATVTFAAGMVIAEYVIYRIYPILGGLSDAYTQYENSLLLQIVTVTGIYGISYIIYWTAAVTIWFWNKRSELHLIKKYVSIYLTVIGIVFVYGAVMYQSVGMVTDSVRVAAVTVPVSTLLNEDEDVYTVFYTDSFTNKNMINAKRKLSEVTEELFLKTTKEAQADAKVVFWSELNGAVLKEDETELLQRASCIANAQDIYLLVSLLVKTPYKDLKENKTVAFNPQGEQILEYYKFGRSIGELCLKGNGELKSFDTEYGRIAPFICSDMAFPSEIRQAGKNDVDILIVPASDWKEMTEIAIKTAVVRGVENGCSVVRHTNNGKSIVSDASGDIHAQADYFQSDTKALAAQVLTGGRFTVYSHVGDVFVFLFLLYLLVTFSYRILIITVYGTMKEERRREQMLEKKPNMEEIDALVGASLCEVWTALCAAINEKYDMECLWNRGGKAWDYEYKYRRGGKTLCALYVREGCVGFMVILGKEERKKFENARMEFSEGIRIIYDESKTYHDGKWMMFLPEDTSMFVDFMRLLEIKRKPNRKKP